MNTSSLESIHSPTIYVKKLGHREILFKSASHLELFESILAEVESGIDFEDALIKYACLTSGDAFVKLAFANVKQKLHWDVVLNYDSLDISHERFRRAFEYELLSQSLVLERETAIDGKSETFIKILCPFEKLSEEAELIRLHLPLKSHRFQPLKRMLSQPITKSFLNCHRWKSLDENRRLQLLTGQYKRKKLNHFLGNSDSEIVALQQLFTNSQRNLLAYGLIMRIRFYYDEGKKSKNLEKLLHEGIYNHFYALHDGSHHLCSTLNLRSELNQKWKGFTKGQPIHDVRDYYGEKIAFYFAWLEHYTFWLLLLSVMGVGVFIYGIVISFSFKFSFQEVDLSSVSAYTTIFDNMMTLPFAFCTSCWGVLYVQWWKRRNMLLAVHWSVNDFIKDERTRPAYYGNKMVTSQITGKWEPHFTKDLFYLISFFSISITLVMLMIVVISVESFILYNAWISYYLRAYHPDLAYLSSVTSAAISLLVSMILSPICRWISLKLTNLENHKTSSEHHNAMISKYLLFDFVNFYGILLYIALGKIWIQKSSSTGLGIPTWQEQCLYKNCMIELTLQMIVIFVGRSLLQHFINFMEPIISRGYTGLKRNEWTQRLIKKTINRRYKRNLGTNESLVSTNDIRLPQYFVDANLASKDLENSEIDGYNAAVVQFGFIILFSASFPLAPLFGALHNFIQFRIDSRNLLVHYQRPFALQAQNIGVWETWLEMMVYLGILVNACTIAFSSPYFESFYLSRFETESQKWVARLAFILIFEHGVLLVQILVRFIFPSIPENVSIALKRREYIDKLLRGEKDKDEDDEQEHLKKVKFCGQCLC